MNVFGKNVLAWLLACTMVRIASSTLQSEYFTNFSTIDYKMWQVDTGCFDCGGKKKKHRLHSKKNSDECTMNAVDKVHPGSIAENAGLTITTARKSNLNVCSPTAGGYSGHLTFKPG